jgi:hypothetical protein
MARTNREPHTEGDALATIGAPTSRAQMVVRILSETLSVRSASGVTVLLCTDRKDGRCHQRR